LTEAHYGNTQTFEPKIDSRQFSKVLSQLGFLVVHKKITDTACSCKDTLTGHADPSCSLCGGTGKVIEQRKVKVIFREHLPHGIYRASTITIVGENDRYDAVIFTDYKYGNRINIGDFIIIDDIEYRINNKVKRRASKGKVLYIRFEMFKTLGGKMTE